MLFSRFDTCGRSKSFLTAFTARFITRRRERRDHALTVSIIQANDIWFDFRLQSINDISRLNHKQLLVVASHAIRNLRYSAFDFKMWAALNTRFQEMLPYLAPREVVSMLVAFTAAEQFRLAAGYNNRKQASHQQIIKVEQLLIDTSEHIIRNSKSFSANQLIDAVHCLGVLGLDTASDHHERAEASIHSLMNVISNEIPSKLQFLDARAITRLWESMALLNTAELSILPALADYVVLARVNFNSKQLISLVKSATKLEYSDRRLYDALVAMITSRDIALQLTLADLAEVLAALSKKGFLSKRIFFATALTAALSSAPAHKLQHSVFQASSHVHDSETNYFPSISAGATQKKTAIHPLLLVEGLAENGLQRQDLRDEPSKRGHRSLQQLGASNALIFKENDKNQTNIDLQKGFYEDERKPLIHSDTKLLIPSMQGSQSGEASTPYSSKTKDILSAAVADAKKLLATRGKHSPREWSRFDGTDIRGAAPFFSSAEFESFQKKHGDATQFHRSAHVTVHDTLQQARLFNGKLNLLPRNLLIGEEKASNFIHSSASKQAKKLLLSDHTARAQQTTALQHVASPPSVTSFSNKAPGRILPQTGPQSTSILEWRRWFEENANIRSRFAAVSMAGMAYEGWKSRRGAYSHRDMHKDLRRRARKERLVEAKAISKQVDHLKIPKDEVIVKILGLHDANGGWLPHAYGSFAGDKESRAWLARRSLAPVSQKTLLSLLTAYAHLETFSPAIMRPILPLAVPRSNRLPPKTIALLVGGLARAGIHDSHIWTKIGSQIVRSLPLLDGPSLSTILEAVSAHVAVAAAASQAALANGEDGLLAARRAKHALGLMGPVMTTLYRRSHTLEDFQLEKAIWDVHGMLCARDALKSSLMELGGVGSAYLSSFANSRRLLRQRSQEFAAIIADESKIDDDILDDVEEANETAKAYGEEIAPPSQLLIEHLQTRAEERAVSQESNFQIQAGVPLGGTPVTDRFLVEELVVALAVRRIEDKVRKLQYFPSKHDTLLLAKEGWTSRHSEFLTGSNPNERVVKEVLRLAPRFESEVNGESIQNGSSTELADKLQTFPEIDFKGEGDALNVQLIPISSRAKEPIDVYMIWASANVETEEECFAHLANKIVQRCRGVYEAPSQASANFSTPQYPWASQKEREIFVKP